MVDVVEFAQILLFGLINGSIIAVGAVGLTLSYGVTRFINFAYGEFLTYGAYTTLFLATTLSVGVPLSAVIAIVLVGLFGVVVARVFYDPLSSKGPIPLLITSIGVAFVLRNLLRIFAGADSHQLPTPLMRPWNFAGLHITPVEVTLLGAGVVTMLGIHLLLKYTLMGKKMRATSGNKTLARVSGIDTGSVVTRTWFISALVGGLAGVLLAVQFAPFRVTMGWDFLIVVFAATLLGGIGKPYGAMAGSLIVGVAMSLGTFYISSDYTMGYAFAILVGVLLVRPEGIAGGEL